MERADFRSAGGGSSGTVDNYQLYQQKNGGGWSLIYTGMNRSKGVVLVDGAYKFRVRSYNTEGSYTAYTAYRMSGNSLVAKTPGTPSSISNNATSGSGSFAVSWGSSSGTVDRYQLYQQKNGGSWSLIYTGTSRSKSVALTDGIYKFRARAYNAQSTYKSYSRYRASGNTIVAKTPGTPSSISNAATSGSGSLAVSWGASSGTVDNYQLYQQKNGGSWSLIYTGTSRSKNVALTDGTYKFRVRAYNAESTYTTHSSYRTSGNSVVAKTPGTPSSISNSTTSSSGSFTVSWGTASGTVDSYQLYQQIYGGSWSLIYTGTSRSKNVALTDGTYKFRVRAYNAESTYIAYSSYRTSSNSLVAKTPGTPSSISNVATSGSGSLVVSWGASNGTVDNYQLYQQKNGGSWTSIYKGISRSKSVALTDGTYKFRVRAYNSEGNYTAYSNYRTSNNSIVAKAPGTPSSITNTATSGTGHFVVSWGLQLVPSININCTNKKIIVVVGVSFIRVQTEVSLCR